MGISLKFLSGMVVACTEEQVLLSMIIFCFINAVVAIALLWVLQFRNEA